MRKRLRIKLILGLILCILLVKYFYLTTHERVIIAYLDQSSGIFADVLETKQVRIASPKYFIPTAAIEITDNAIQKIENLKTPKECLEHRRLCLEAMKYIRKYHIMKKDDKESEMTTIRRNEVDYEIPKIEEISLKAIDFEVKKNSEFYRIVFEIGSIRVMAYRYFQNLFHGRTASPQRR